MNKKAHEIGLENTHFVTPHGLDDPEHYTTAYELAILTNYALENEQFAKIVNTKTRTILINGRQQELYNTNELLGNLNGINGVKTGFTNNAGRCLVCSCKRDNMNVISVVLGADTKKFRTKDSIQIIEYVYNNYEIIPLGQMINQEFEKWEKSYQNTVTIQKAKNQKLELEWNNPYKEFPIKKENMNKIKIEIQCENEFIAPVYENTYVGKISIFIGEKKLNELNIVTSQNVERKGTWEYFKEIIINYSTFIID